MMRKPLVKMNERQALERMSSRCAKSEQCEADVRRKLAEWEQDDAAADRIVERLRAELKESAAALRVRLVVDCGVGDNWLEAH